LEETTYRFREGTVTIKSMPPGYEPPKQKHPYTIGKATGEITADIAAKKLQPHGSGRVSLDEMSQHFECVSFGEYCEKYPEVTSEPYDHHTANIALALTARWISSVLGEIQA